MKEYLGIFYKAAASQVVRSVASLLISLNMMLIVLASMVATGTAGLVNLEKEARPARQIPNQEFDRYYNDLYVSKGENGERYNNFDDDYFDKLTIDSDNEVTTKFDFNLNINQHTDDEKEKTELSSNQDPSEVLSRLLFYMSKLPLL